MNIPEFEWFVLFNQEGFESAVLAGFAYEEDAYDFLRTQPNTPTRTYEVCTKDELLCL